MRWTAATALGLLLAGPNVADAATVNRGGGAFFPGGVGYVAASGERNVVTITGEAGRGWLIEESSATLSAVDGCVAENAQRVRCPPAGVGDVGAIEVQLGDQDDRVELRAGYGHIEGDEGNDVLIGGPAIDTVWGGEGNDILVGGDGDDLLDGDASNDGSKAQAGGDDVLLGGAGADALQGGLGSDRLDGGPGNDILEGDPTTIARAGGGRGIGGRDTVAGGSGVDHVVYNLQPADLRQARRVVAPVLGITLDGRADDGPPREQDSILPGVERAYSLAAATLNPVPGAGAPIVQPLLDARLRPLGDRVGARIYRLSRTGTRSAQGGRFEGAAFRVRDPGRRDEPTQLQLTGGDFADCPTAASARYARAVPRAAERRRSRKPRRRLRARAKGLFKVNGEHVTLGVQGTAYELIELCDASIVRVTEGVVVVTSRGRNVRVRAGTTLRFPAH